MATNGKTKVELLLGTREAFENKCDTLSECNSGDCNGGECTYLKQMEEIDAKVKAIEDIEAPRIQMEVRTILFEPGPAIGMFHVMVVD